MKANIKIQIQLYSILRDKLPPGSKGRTELQLQSGANLQDLLDKLDIPGRVVISVNNRLENDPSRKLQDGDNVRIFSSISGG